MTKSDSVVTLIITTIIVVSLLLMKFPLWILLVPVAVIILLGFGLYNNFSMWKQLQNFANKRSLKIISRKKMNIRELLLDFDPTELYFQKARGNQKDILKELIPELTSVGYNCFSPTSDIVTDDNILLFIGDRTSIRRGMGSFGRSPMSMSGIFFFFRLNKPTPETVSFQCLVPARSLIATNKYDYWTKLSKDLEDINKNKVFQIVKPIIESSNPSKIFELTIKEDKALLSIVYQSLKEKDISLFFDLCKNIQSKLNSLWI